MTNRVASCSCGQLTLITSEEPIRVSVCHCLACQRRTGSVFGAQARFREEAVRITGKSSEYVRIGDEGSRSVFQFCADCGATVHYRIEGLPGFVAVPVGAFAEPGFPAPSFSVYEQRMHPWVSVPACVEHME
ncbi:MAG: GFA family protein [Casimicrobiaceae bacterium]